MGTDTRYVDAFMAPLTPKWRTAVDRFLQYAWIPLEHPKLALLGFARDQLADGRMVDDNLIHAYTHLLGQVRLSVPTIYTDPINEIQLSTSNGELPTLRQLNLTADVKNTQHIFWPVHHHDTFHWSLVHIDRVRKVITGHDSFNGLGEKRTSTATMTIHSFCMRTLIADPAERETRTTGTSAWRLCSQVQAASSNDCGTMVMLLIRFLRADSKPPVLPENRKDRVNVMRWVGGRMRRRIAAELIAGQINPTDEMLPQWLSSA